MPDSVNPLWADVKPELSVLIPFLNDDPTPLLLKLDQEAEAIGSRVEIVLLDDGSRSPELTSSLVASIQKLSIAARLITSGENLGRAKGRNQLAASARGDYLLFLDADMLPDSISFISEWFDFIGINKPDVAFGGFSLLQASRHKSYAVHRAMAQKSDCIAASLRQKQPEKYLYTSNLLIKSSLFAAYPFDENFKGWGWEDVEWGMRISRHAAIHHPDLSATHMGLDTVDALIRKYGQSASNFARIARLHPEIVADYPSFKVAKAIQSRSMAAPVAQVSKWMALQEWLPPKLRGFSLRIYRSALYAAALDKADLA